MNYSISQLTTLFDVTAIVNIAYYKLESNFIFPGESHDFWEILYVDRGSLVLKSDTDNYILKAGEMVFHSPNEFHAFQSAGSSDIFVISFCCTSPSMNRFKGKVLPLHTAERDCLQALISEATQSYEYFELEAPLVNLKKLATAPFGSDQLIKNHLERLFILICRRDDNIEKELRILSSKQNHRHYLLAQQTKDYLKRHYTEKLTLVSISKALGISCTQLKKIFKEQTELTVIAYLTQLRISEAKRLIRQREYSFTQVAHFVGFDNIYYFSNLFKKHTGMTPTEYSKSLKG